VAIILCAIHTGAAAGQVYPARPLRLVVGQGVDTLPRLIGQKLTEDWGQQVVIDQRPGAGGIIAAETVAKATPDGYTLLLSTRSYTINSIVNPKFRYDLTRDFSPVSLLVSIPFMLVVNPLIPAKSVDDLIRLARAKPGQLNCASSGTGTVSHLGCAMLNHMAKVSFVHVPYKSMVPAVTDLIGDRVQMLILATQAGLPFVKSGQLKALAVTGSARSSVAPDLPTMAESGMSDFAVDSWNGIHAPADAPPVVIKKLGAELVKIVKAPDMQKRMLSHGWESVGSTPEQFGAYVKADTARWTKVIKDAGIHVDY